MALSGMRGLSVFISDIRNCHNKEQERLRVDKELGNIRTRFKNEKLALSDFVGFCLVCGAKFRCKCETVLGLSHYEKKKYVWKMLYIHMLGYDVDFGHMETVSLISAPKYPEKQVGYIVTSCLLNENNDFLRMVINTVRNDIIGRNETYQCLALTMVGNIGGKEFSESLAPDVQKLLISSSCRPVVRKKAALCLLRLYRKNPDVVNIDGWSDRMAQLLDERDLGVLTSVMSLFVSLVSNNAEAYWNCLPKCVRILERMARNQDIPQEYTYYGIPSPWLQVKAMRALQYFPTIEDPSARRALFEVLQRILMGTDVVKNVNKNNASHAVLFEALALVMHLDAEKEMMSQCVALLGKFIAVREPNIRYLGLENMSRMLLVTDVQDIIKRHQAQIITSLKDPDISIRRRALDLLYGMCDVTNAKEIVEELLQYLNTAEFAMREELALKAAILAEKFAPNLSWYVDVILQLIDKAGDFVSDDIWYRVVQFVTNNEDLQAYAAAKAREYLDKPALHETMVKVSAYLLGEYGHLLAQRPSCSPKELFTIINDRLPTVSSSTVAIIISAYAKILMHTQPPDAGLQQQILAIFKKHESYIDVEIQQRAVEYFELSRKGPALADVLAEMPKFPERESALLKKAEDAEVDTAEQSAIKLRSQQQSSSAIVVAAQPPVNGPAPAANHLTLVKMPSQNIAEESNVIHEETAVEAPKENGAPVEVQRNVEIITEPAPVSKVEPPASRPASQADLLADLLGPLAIEGPPAAVEQTPAQGLEANQSPVGDLALATLEDQSNSVQPIVNVEEKFNILCTKDSGVLYEDPNIQVQIPVEVTNLRASRDVAVLDFSYKHGAALVNAKLRLPIVLHKFLQPITLKLSSVPDTIPPRAQVQIPVEVTNLRASRDVAVLDFSYKHGAALVRGVKPLPIPEMASLLLSLHLAVTPGLDTNPNNMVACATFFSETTNAALCLVRVETDPQDRSQLRLTVASGDQNLTFEYTFLLSPLLESAAAIYGYGLLETQTLMSVIFRRTG
uniref:AP-2 complex subunit alpha n=1 Tax=Aegilops tauschii TaxID=37682 RepID=R7WC91_AEGTA